MQAKWRNPLAGRFGFQVVGKQACDLQTGLASPGTPEGTCSLVSASDPVPKSSPGAVVVKPASEAARLTPSATA